MRLLALAIAMVFLVPAIGCNHYHRGRGPILVPPGKVKPKRVPPGHRKKMLMDHLGNTALNPEDGISRVG